MCTVQTISVTIFHLLMVVTLPRHCVRWAAALYITNLCKNHSINSARSLWCGSPPHSAPLFTRNSPSGRQPVAAAQELHFVRVCHTQLIKVEVPLEITCMSGMASFLLLENCVYNTLLMRIIREWKYSMASQRTTLFSWPWINGAEQRIQRFLQWILRKIFLQH